MTTLGLTAASAGAVSVSLIDEINNIIIPFIGVPVTVVTMAAAGAGVSFIHGDREPDTPKMFKQILANTFVSLLLIVIVPKMFSMHWVEPGITPPLAALVAWGSRWAIPATIKRFPDIVKRTFKLKEYNDRGYGSEDYSDSRSLKERYYDEDTKE